MRSYKILRIAGLHYSSPMNSFFRSNPSLINARYDEQQKHLFEKSYTYGDSFSRSMRILGHDAHEIVYDFEPMQKTWAKENGVTYRSAYWLWDILLAQVGKLKPDVLYFQDLHSLPYEIRKDLKNRFPFLKLITIFRGFPGTFPEIYKELSTADLLFVGSPALQRKCKTAGLSPLLIYHYFDEVVLKKIIQPTHKEYGFTFIGSSGFGYESYHEPRYRALVELLQKTDLEVWSDENGLEMFKTPKQILKKFLRDTSKHFLQLFPVTVLDQISNVSYVPSSLKGVAKLVQKEKIASKRDDYIPMKPLCEVSPQKCHPAAFGVDMYRLLASSKVTFNKHTAPAEGTADNIRLFQATGVGACLLTDHGSNITDLFEPDREIVTYSSTDECIEKVKYLLDHENERALIADRGQKRTLRDHTSLERCKQMDAIFQEALRR